MSSTPTAKKPSASSTQVPTIQSLHLKTTKRSTSFNTAEEPSPSSPSSNPKNKVDETGADNMMKASLTGLLNSEEVRSEARERKVQNMLMDTQKDLREQRRASLRSTKGVAGRGSLCAEGVRGDK